MADFSRVPVKQNARTSTLRNARLGVRQARPAPNYSDAFATVESLQRLREAYVREKSSIPFFQALSDAWAARKNNSSYPTP